MTVSSDVTKVWQRDLVTLSLTLVLKIEDGKENQKENENRKEKENKLSSLFLSLTDILVSGCHNILSYLCSSVF